MLSATLLTCLLFVESHTYQLLASMPQQIHLSLGKSHSEMVVTWTTYLPVGSMVVYGENELTLELSQRGTGSVFVDNGNRVHYIHRVVLKNLKPFTKYYYQCANGKFSETHSFRTLSDATDWSPRMLVFGDLGVHNGVTIPYLIREVDNGTVDILFHNGDFAYNFDDELSYRGDEFMRLMEPAISKMAYQTSPGNHEATTPANLANYLHRFSMFDMTAPANQTAKSDHYYAFHLGPALLISVNNEVYVNYYSVAVPHTVRAEQEKWLVAVLEEANQPDMRARHPWIIVFGHQAMYCHSKPNEQGCNTENKKVRAGLEDILYKYGVDLAIWAHMHEYERQLPVYKHEVRVSNLQEPYRNPKAPVHIVSGSAGCREYLDSTFLVRPSWNVFRSATYGFGILNIINATNLVWQQKAINGESMDVIDQFELIQEVHGPRV